MLLILSIHLRVLNLQQFLVFLCILLACHSTLQFHVLNAHEVHFSLLSIKHANHVANAFSRSAIIIKGNIARSNNQQSALVVLHEHHLTAILLLAVQLALVAPSLHMLLHGLSNLRHGAIIHARSLSLGVDVVGKRRKLFLCQSRVYQLHVYLRFRKTLLCQSLILLLQHIVAFQGSIKRLFCIIHVVQHLSHSLVVRILRAKVILLNHVLALCLRLFGMQRSFRELFSLISLSQSHTSVLFLLAALQRVFVHSCLQLFSSKAKRLSYSLQCFLCRLLVLYLSCTIGITQTLVFFLRPKIVFD